MNHLFFSKPFLYPDLDEKSRGIFGCFIVESCGESFGRNKIPTPLASIGEEAKNTY